MSNTTRKFQRTIRFTTEKSKSDTLLVGTGTKAHMVPIRTYKARNDSASIIDLGKLNRNVVLAAAFHAQTKPNLTIPYVAPKQKHFLSGNAAMNSTQTTGH